MRYSRGPLSVAEEVEGRENDEKRLLRHLMRGYERDVRPVKNASTPVVIQLSITLTQIFDMVKAKQISNWVVLHGTSFLYQYSIDVTYFFSIYYL